MKRNDRLRFMQIQPLPSQTFPPLPHRQLHLSFYPLFLVYCEYVYVYAIHYVSEKKFPLRKSFYSSHNSFFFSPSLVHFSSISSLLPVSTLDYWWFYLGLSFFFLQFFVILLFFYSYSCSILTCNFSFPPFYIA